MHVLVVAQADPTQTGSGAERVLREQVDALRRGGHAVTVLSGAARAAVRGDALVVEPVGWSMMTPWRARRAARAARPFDAVLLHHAYPGALLVRDRGFVRGPVALAYFAPWHEEYLVRGPARRGVARAASARLRRLVERAVVRRADAVVPMSRFMAERVHALHGVPTARIRVVPGGVDREHFRPPTDRRALRARFDLPATARVVATLRNLEPRMGLLELLRAMPVVRAVDPDVRLVIGGTGPLAAALKAEAVTLGLAAMVRFSGFVPESELPAFYGAADVFVLATQALEGFGLVTLESLACGTPVVGTPVGATPEILAPLDLALMCDGASPDAIARGITRLLARGDLEALRARCRTYTEAFTWDGVTGMLVAELSALAR